MSNWCKALGSRESCVVRFDGIGERPISMVSRFNMTFLSAMNSMRFSDIFTVFRKK